MGWESVEGIWLDSEFDRRFRVSPAEFLQITDVDLPDQLQPPLWRLLNEPPENIPMFGKFPLLQGQAFSGKTTVSPDQPRQRDVLSIPVQQNRLQSHLTRTPLERRCRLIPSAIPVRLGR